MYVKGRASHRITIKLILALSLFALIGCATATPRNLDNACDIFRENRSWYKASKKSQKKWGMPPQIHLAIIYQESKFQPKAKPGRKKLFGILPWKRKSTAYGYAQVKDATWDWYKKEAGGWGADRDDFADAVDFIGWYGSVSQKTLGISKWDAYKQYLAYHEGHGGYKKKSYLKKKWLIDVARKVKKRSEMYGAQLQKCKRVGRRFFFF